MLMQDGDGNYMRKSINVNIIDREEDLFLCGLKTLRDWKGAVFYERNEMEFDVTKKRVSMEMSKGGHQFVKLESLKEWNQERSIIYVKQKDVGLNKRWIEKVPRVLNHKSAKNMEFSFRSAGNLEPGMAKLIKTVVEECDICKKNSRSRS